MGPGPRLPAFYFDGQEYTKIEATENTLAVFYKGWKCCYTVNGKISGGDVIIGNRNGHYKAYKATAKEKLCITISISQEWDCQKEAVQSECSLASVEEHDTVTIQKS